MKPNNELTVPVNNDKARTILGRRGDELRWFTPLGFKNMPNIYTKDQAGKSLVIPTDGWSIVDPSAFKQPPPQTTAAQVVSPQIEGPKKPAQDAVPPVATDPVVPVSPVAPVTDQEKQPTSPGNDQGSNV